MAAVSNLVITKLGPMMNKASWDAEIEGTEFYVYRNAVPILTTPANWANIPGENTVDCIEVFNSSTDIPLGNPSICRPRIQWDHEATATGGYRIDLYVDSEWTKVGFVQETGAQICVFTAPEISEEDDYTYRVTPIIDGQDGIAQTFSFYVIPPPKRKTYLPAYDDETGILSFTEVVAATQTLPTGTLNIDG